MASTDRLTDLGTRSIALGAFIIAYVRWVPSRLAELLGSPTYIGYLISLQFGLIIIIVFSIAYLLMYLADMQEEIEGEIDQSFNYYLSELAPFDPDSLDETGDGTQTDEDEGIEDVATDGGSKPVDSNGNGISTVDRQTASEEKDSERQDGPRQPGMNSRSDSDRTTAWSGMFISQLRGRAGTTGRGLLIGVFVGIPLGLLYSLDATVVGGVLGGILGNEIEYQGKKTRNGFDLLDLPHDLPTGISLDALYDILKSQRRRWVLRIINDADNTVSIQKLAERIAALENEKSENQVTAQERKRVFVSLYQLHLPKLDGADIVRYQRTTGSVERGELFDEIFQIQDALTTSQPLPEGITRDHLYEILKNQRRRHVLQIMSGSDTPLTLGELAEQIAAWENDKQVAQVSADERKRMYVGLYQGHLPRLEKAGIVRFDREKGTVEKGRFFDDLFDHDDRGTIDDYVNSLVSDNTVFTTNESLYYLLISTFAVSIYLISWRGWLSITANRMNTLFLIYAALIAIPSIYKLTRKR